MFMILHKLVGAKQIHTVLNARKRLRTAFQEILADSVVVRAIFARKISLKTVSGKAKYDKIDKPSSIIAPLICFITGTNYILVIKSAMDSLLLSI